ncbi:Gld1p Ecym_4451 [Eremothecium cymbalariae DBVPG|uniref:Uncharacterized protein n=1 Tax=Eremothecium cymbalariae (strain CBS 270.75 / DBVPG 7215 / KCTC 17166 / NRRL Y-17582) TaxID=931890 RepID=G8JTZ3_ERECY|nr:hypothetical protein Ecym_4451 [Eremothecium cymbalariae DBVPG\
MDVAAYKRTHRSMVRRKFREKLVEHLGLLGYAVIVIGYMKYGGSIIVFFMRCMLQSALVTPFPNHEQRMRGFSIAGTVRGFPAMPGNTNPNPVVSQDERMQAQDLQDIATEFFLKIQWVLFHAVFTFNWLVILSWIIWPTDYQAMLGFYKYDKHSDLANAPSPFNNDNYLIQGEWRGTWFMEFIGEAIPSSNKKGNLMAICYQFMILISQFGLYMLSCIYFSPLRGNQLSENDEDACNDGDGYDGSITIVTVDPVEAVRVVHGITIDSQGHEESPSAMV